VLSDAISLSAAERQIKAMVELCKLVTLPSLWPKLLWVFVVNGIEVI
jgi:hypothetical protein